MNIFWLDDNLQKCAEYHCDSHVRKMILESAQMLCTAHWYYGYSAPYQPTHINHPCSKWVRESTANYIELRKLALNLCKEYTYRWGRIHKTEQVIGEIFGPPRATWPQVGLTIKPRCMPKKYECLTTVDSYRNYYRTAKRHLLQYTTRQKPDWIDE